MAGAIGARRVVVSGVVLVGYVASVLFSILLTRAGGHSATVWTANGFLAGGFILLHRGWRPTVAAMCFLSQMAIGLAAGDDLLRLLVSPTVNVVEAALAAWLAIRFCGARARRFSLRELVMLPVGAIVPAVMVGAAIGAVENLIRIGQPLASGWWAWAAPDLFGMVITLPALLLMARIRQYKEFRRSPWEVAAIGLGLCGLTAAIFLQPGMPLQFLIYPALTFVAFRLGPPGAAVAGALIALICLPLVLLGHGPASFTSAFPLGDRVRLVELAVAALLFTTLATAGALADQLRLRRMMLWRDKAARDARSRARRAERLAVEAGARQGQDTAASAA